MNILGRLVGAVQKRAPSQVSPPEALGSLSWIFAGLSRRLEGVRHLWDVEFSGYSQFGEDGILDFLCQRLQIAKPRILELGAADFSECNSRLLAETRSASVFAVDSNPRLETNLRGTDFLWKNPVITRVTWITPENVSDIVREATLEFGGLDLLSLDIDGNDFWVSEEIDYSGISVVVVEYNPIFGASLGITVPRDDSFARFGGHYSGLYYGCSLRAWVDSFEARGFSFLGVNRAGHNAFFVRSEALAQFDDITPQVDRTLSSYCDWRVRDSRDESGKLTYKPWRHYANELGKLPLVVTSSGETIFLAEVFEGEANYFG